jgi:hypothetical protein
MEEEGVAKRGEGRRYKVVGVVSNFQMYGVRRHWSVFKPSRLHVGLMGNETKLINVMCNM